MLIIPSSESRLAGSECLCYTDGWHIVTADSRYGTPLYIPDLYQCPNVTGLTHLSSPRNLYHKSPPYNGFGRPGIHGDVFKLHDAKGRSVRMIIEAWHEMHFQKAPHCPFTLVKVATYKADGQLRFKHPLWLAVTHRHGLSLKEIPVAYLRRPVIEHFNRFVKQHLLFEAAQMGSVEQDERWIQVVRLAYWQLYASRNAVERDVRPWERYKPRPPANQPATPSQTRRAFG
jgi:hypothetical protein